MPDLTTRQMRARIANNQCPVCGLNKDLNALCKRTFLDYSIYLDIRVVHPARARQFAAGSRA